MFPLFQWDHEKWKFDSRNEVVLFSQVTNKPLRVKPDGTVDALGDLRDSEGLYLYPVPRNILDVFFRISSVCRNVETNEKVFWK